MGYGVGVWVVWGRGGGGIFPGAAAGGAATRVSNAIIDSLTERAETGASRIGSWPGKWGLDPEPWRRTPVSRQSRAFDEVEIADS